MSSLFPAPVKHQWPEKDQCMLPKEAGGPKCDDLASWLIAGRVRACYAHALRAVSDEIHPTNDGVVTIEHYTS